MTSTSHPAIVHPRPPAMELFRHRLGRTVSFLILAVISLVTLFPLIWMLSGAFKSGIETYLPVLIPANPTWENFQYVLTQVPFPRYMLNSFFISAMVTLIALWFHSMAAYALARLRFPGREAIFSLIFATFLVSLPVILVPLFILVRTLGLLDSYQGLIIPALFNAFGIFLLRQFYLGIPPELEEAAILDGASYWRIYLNIILPLSKPILAALAVFFFLANWNSFLWPLSITNNPDLYVVQIGISSFRQQYSGSQNYVMAASTIVAIPTMALFFIFQRQLVESIKTSGLK